MPVETASPPAVVPMKPPRLRLLPASTSKPVPTKPDDAEIGCVWRAKTARVLRRRYQSRRDTFTTAPMRPEKALKRCAVIREQRQSVWSKRRIARARFVRSDAVTQSAVDPQAIGNRGEVVLREETV